MSKFTAADLVEFYQKVADGGEIEVLHSVNERDSIWKEAFGNDSPCLFSNTLTWRIKPTKKIIDMDHLVKSGIDCEFDDKKVPSATIVGPLLAIYTNGNTAHKYQACLHKWQNCRPRMNHKMYWGGGECPLPEGFVVKIYYSDRGNHTSSEYVGQSWGLAPITNNNIIGYEILGLADGWAYPWEYVDED